MMIIPFALFWTLVLFGSSILGWKGVLSAVAVWILVSIVFYSLELSSYYFIGFQVFLDIILVFIIFGGDIRIR